MSKRGDDFPADPEGDRMLAQRALAQMRREFSRLQRDLASRPGGCFHTAA